MSSPCVTYLVCTVRAGFSSSGGGYNCLSIVVFRFRTAYGRVDSVEDRIEDLIEGFVENVIDDVTEDIIED